MLTIWGPHGPCGAIFFDPWFSTRLWPRRLRRGQDGNATGKAQTPLLQFRLVVPVRSDKFPRAGATRCSRGEDVCIVLLPSEAHLHGLQRVTKVGLGRFKCIRVDGAADGWGLTAPAGQFFWTHGFFLGFEGT